MSERVDLLDLPIFGSPGRGGGDAGRVRSGFVYGAEPVGDDPVESDAPAAQPRREPATQLASRSGEGGGVEVHPKPWRVPYAASRLKAAVS